jgi:hypothetical protein
MSNIPDQSEDKAVPDLGTTSQHAPRGQTNRYAYLAYAVAAGAVATLILWSPPDDQTSRFAVADPPTLTAADRKAALMAVTPTSHMPIGARLEALDRIATYARSELVHTFLTAPPQGLEGKDLKRLQDWVETVVLLRNKANEDLKTGRLKEAETALRKLWLVPFQRDALSVQLRQDACFALSTLLLGTQRAPNAVMWADKGLNLSDTPSAFLANLYAIKAIALRLLRQEAHSLQSYRQARTTYLLWFKALPAQPAETR